MCWGHSVLQTPALVFFFSAGRIRVCKSIGIFHGFEVQTEISISMSLCGIIRLR